ncbi:hypothetical protein [Tahibacter amnicola]|uniref:Polysaccharide lyase-like protein n=1 Tax=Tahibacter amnicola TaxID=2976241 RepID=A0ABY6BGS4_9GAMM|nr:hypothetical protein [Tahibacter amnicola]UXI67570.1 hypothetical protein N4264_22985 [Tahibacter amnicola]
MKRTLQHPLQRRALGTAFAASQLLAGVALAQDCTRPEGLGPAVSFGGGSAAWIGPAGSPCDLSAVLDGAYNYRMGGFAAGQLPSAQSHFRARFRVDTSGLTQLTQVTDSTALFTLVGAENQPAEWNARSRHLAWIGLVGRFSATDLTVFLGDSSGLAKQVPVSGPFDLAVEVAAIESGYLKFWVNGTYSDPPTARLPEQGFVDLSAYEGIAGYAIGNMAPGTGFLPSHAGQPIVMRNIDFSEHLFGDGFE